MKCCQAGLVWLKQKAKLRQSAAWPGLPVLTWFLGIGTVVVLAACNLDRRLYKEHMVPETAQLEGLTATWLGTAGLLLSDAESQILIDPFVSREAANVLEVSLLCNLRPNDQLIAEWIDKIGAQGTKAVLVSHSHYDHSMDAPLFAKRLGAVLVGSASTANIARGLKLPETQIIEVGEAALPLTFGSFTVRMLPSQHGKALLGRVPYPGTIQAPLTPPACGSDYKLGMTYSIVIEHALGTMLHHASAGWNDGMFKGIHADLVFLGLAGRPKTETYLKNVVDAVGARRVIAIHFDDFFRPLSDGITFLVGVNFEGFLRRAATRERPLQVQTLPLGATRTILR